MRRPLLAALIFLAIGPVPGTHHRRPAIDTSQRVRASPLHYPAADTGMVRFVRGWRLSSANSMFGGFSGLGRLAPNRFQLVGDNGFGVRLTLGDDGRVADAAIRRLPTPNGHPRRKAYSDVEALFVDPVSGTSWVVLEGVDQVWRLDAALTRVEARHGPPALARWPANRGAEAMVRLADGRTAIFAEGDLTGARATQALLYRGDPAVPGPPPLRFVYDAGGKGQVSDAAPLPDGRILLVHRRLGIDPLFTTILSVADPADIKSGAVLRSTAIGRVPAPLRENYEGAAIAVENGRIYLWLVSDDNFNVWQRSLLLQFELVGLPPPPKTDSKKAAP